MSLTCEREVGEDLRVGLIEMSASRLLYSKRSGRMKREGEDTHSLTVEGVKGRLRWTTSTSANCVGPTAGMTLNRGGVGEGTSTEKIVLFFNSKFTFSFLSMMQRHHQVHDALHGTTTMLSRTKP